MLQTRYSLLSLLALAVAAPGVAYANPAVSVAGVMEDANAGANLYLPSGAAEGLMGAIESERKKMGLSGLNSHETLAGVAEAHARDMARRGYAADVTPEGLSIMDQARMSDRQSLYSAFGTNIVIVDADTSLQDLHAILMSETANRENILRKTFDHAGIGTIERDGRLYVVQVFARIDGSLQQPLPMSADKAPSIKAAFSQTDMTPVSWAVSDSQGDMVMRGSGDYLRKAGEQGVEGYVSLDVALGTDVYTLRGPYVRLD